MDGEPISERVILEVGEPEQAVFWAWAERTGLDVDALENEGCGCCVDIYEVRATAGQLAELNALLDAAQS